MTQSPSGMSSRFAGVTPEASGRAAALVVATAVLGGLLAAPLDGQTIPAHPTELTFAPLDYEAPDRSSYRRVLSNGVVGYFAEDHDLPLITVSVLLRGGSYLDPAGLEGLAEAVGDLMRDGGTERLTAEAFDEEVDFLAADLSTGFGAIAGSARVNFLSKDADAALALLFEVLRTPRFQEDRLSLHKRQQQQAIERRNDETDTIESREWTRLLRGDDHFTARPTTRASIDALTRAELQAFHQRYVHPGNMILAVSGAFDTATMVERLEAALEGWPAGEAAPPVPAPEHVPVPGLYVVDKPDVNQGRVSMGHVGIQMGHPDEIALSIMNDVLGGSGLTSRLANRIRSDEGLAYSAGSSFTPATFYPGLFRVAFQSRSEAVARAIGIVIEEIERLREEPVPADELDTVKAQAIEVFPRYFASARSIVGTFANDEFAGRPMDYWETYRDRVREVTAQDVLRVAREHLHPDGLVVLAVGNVADMVAGEADRPGSGLANLALGPMTRIPLPDPATMVYPTP